MVNSEVAEHLEETEQAQNFPKLKRYRRSDSSDDDTKVQKNENLMRAVRSKKSEEDKIKEIEALINPSCGLANEVKLRNAGLFRLHGI